MLYTANADVINLAQSESREVHGTGVTTHTEVGSEEERVRLPPL